MPELIKPTLEQQFAIEQAHKGESFKVIAYAGTGKTTTLKLVSDAIQHRRGMLDSVVLISCAFQWEAEGRLIPQNE